MLSSEQADFQCWCSLLWFYQFWFLYFRSILRLASLPSDAYCDCWSVKHYRLIYQTCSKKM